jgi:hypothetical protein
VIDEIRLIIGSEDSLAAVSPPGMCHIERKLMVIIWKESECNIWICARSIVRGFVDGEFIGGGLVVAGCVEALG